MIGKLSGRLEYRGSDHVLIDVGGVGYVVYVSERTLSALPAVGQGLSLFTELVVREDLLQLLGFPTMAEKEWHRLLTSVQGVGAKASLAILGALGPDGVARAIALGDWNAVKAARGIGPKTAQRVVNELQDKAAGVMGLIETPQPAATTAANPPAAPLPDTGSAAVAEALSALSNLGYAPAEAARAVAQAEEVAGGDVSALIRESLKRLAPKG